MKKSRVLIVGAFPPEDARIYGGIVTTCRTLLHSSFASKFDLILIDSTQISNPPPGLGLRAVLAFRRYIRFIVCYVSEKPDAVLLFTSVGASVIEKGAMAWLSRARSIPVFIFPRAGGLIDTVRSSPLRKLWVKAALRGATHFLCQGPTWQKFATNEIGFTEAHAPIVPNWSATTTLLKMGASRAMSVNHYSPTLLFLGWLEEEKGISQLLEACREVSKRYKIKVIIAGCGHAEEDTRAFLSAHNLQGSVELVGWVHGPDKDALLANADILVHPSWAEGFPNAVIEAMAAKIAVIVTSVGNVPDLITDRQEALVVPPRDSQALERAIELLCGDLVLRRDLAERGHAFSREKFSSENAVAKLISVIEEAIYAKQSKSWIP